MKRNETVYADEEDEVKTENGWDWWMVLSVVTLAVLVYQIAVAATTSVFDEDE